ncbi:MAG: glycosyltransferase [bacterium]
MKNNDKVSRVKNIAIIGNYLPRRCGIATFTTDIREALSQEVADNGRVEVLAMDDIVQGYSYPDQVKFQLRANHLSDYVQASDFLNINQYDAVILQHEYGIFGGKLGAHIIRLLKALRMPVLTTLHTVLAEPSSDQRSVMLEVAKYSARLVVMSDKARSMLKEVYNIDDSQITYIPHGIPDFPYVSERRYKDKLDLEGKKIILTFGLLGPGKGIEMVIKAIPEIVAEHPEAVYLILGATHPHIKKTTGDSYRQKLHQLVNQLNLDDFITFHNQFVSREVLNQYLSAADVYVTPYSSPVQITSGSLVYALGMGSAVISTPYWHAQEVLAEGRGRLVPFGDSEAVSREVTKLLSDGRELERMRRKAYQYCRPMIWSRVARDYLELANQVHEEWIKSPKERYRGMDITPKILDELPEISFQHLRVMTDGVGMLQHSTYATPNRNHGYCVDDNARSLIAVSMYYSLCQDDTVIPLIQTYLSFLLYAFNQKNRRFRNFMSYERKWLEDAGSDDSHARSLWGLAIAVKCAPDDSTRDLASRLFMEGLEVVEDFRFPRSLAFTIIALQAYMEVYSGDATARRLRSVLAEKLHKLFVKNSTKKWYWCEEILTYANAKLSQALLLAGQWIPDPDMYQTGIKSLKWLLEQQTASDGHLSLVGNERWFVKGKERSHFDQQPIDAMCLVEACAEAFRSTGDKFWLKEARRCLEWFMGRNDLNLQLYNFKSGSCCDGLTPTGPNPNQGAESTLAGLISLLIMYEVLGQEIMVP